MGSSAVAEHFNPDRELAQLRVDLEGALRHVERIEKAEVLHALDSPGPFVRQALTMVRLVEEGRTRG